MKTIAKNALFLLLLLMTVRLQAQVTIENQYFIYEISETGKNLCFIDKASQKNYLLNTDSYCAYVLLGNKQYNAHAVEYKNNSLTIRFGDSGVSIEMVVKPEKDYINFKVKSFTGNPTSITFLNIPLSLEGMPDEPFAACALSMNLQTRVVALPPLQSHLQATAYNRFGIVGCEVNILCVPQKEILPIIRSIMKQAKELPFSDQGGAWAGLGKEGYGSYLMNFGTLTEKTVDEWIGQCKNLGFTQIDHHGGGDFFTFGDFVLNKEKWPDGWDSFKRMNRRLHKAGISSIFHTYSFFIEKTSSYVSPIPNKDLAHYRTFTLAKPLGKNDTEVYVNESTIDMSTIVGFMENNSVALRIGDEIIEFGGVTKAAPYKFTNCKRGALGTSASTHDASETLFHLREMYGRFVPNPESELFLEVARKTAYIVNEYEFDGIYFDAIDGGWMLADKEASWYHGTKFLMEVTKNLKRPVMMEMSMTMHHWWHYRSRWYAWDSARRGYKRFVDFHTDNVKGGGTNYVYLNPEYQSKIIINSTFDKGKIGLPLHLGWWGLETRESPVVEPTFPDNIEYLCCKMLGNNAGLSILGEVDKEALKETPAFQRLCDMIRTYEDLRHRNYFDESVRVQLRKPGKEFTLIKEGRKRWNFKPVHYLEHKVTGLHEATAQWKETNTYRAQPLRLRMELLMSVKPYDDPGNIVLTDFADHSTFTEREFADGVVASMVPSSDQVTKNFQGNATSLVGYNLGIQPRWGTWAKIGKKFDTVLDLKNHKALGVWIKGDGKGELINLAIESSPHLSFGAHGDRFIKIDFVGWKYFELVEVESTDYTDYNWNKSKGVNLYSIYRDKLAFEAIEKLQVWYNNLPQNEEVKCELSPVKALPLVSNTINNPSITIGNETITFPIKMESGMYLELDENNECILYSSKGVILDRIKIKGNIPTLLAGENQLSFSCDETMNVNTRIQISIKSLGDKIIQK